MHDVPGRYLPHWGPSVQRHHFSAVELHTCWRHGECPEPQQFVTSGLRRNQPELPEHVDPDRLRSWGLMEEAMNRHYPSRWGQIHMAVAESCVGGGYASAERTLIHQNAWL